ncbi:hypothetical protein BC833DRAFT_579510 [Globomyces pollinis-pini]|nr:hypothetical protein BC833DRAFT_579510 [Globomyces pollinis-pini]
MIYLNILILLLFGPEGCFLVCLTRPSDFFGSLCSFPDIPVNFCLSTLVIFDVSRPAKEIDLGLELVLRSV